MGLKPCEFWALTYAEFVEMLDGYNRVYTRKINDMLYHAWHVAALLRQERLPSLESIQIRDEKEHRQTDDEIMANCRRLNAMLGGIETEV